MRKEEWECILDLIDCRLSDEAAEYMLKTLNARSGLEYMLT